MHFFREKCIFALKNAARGAAAERRKELVQVRPHQRSVLVEVEDVERFPVLDSLTQCKYMQIVSGVY